MSHCVLLSTDVKRFILSTQPLWDTTATFQCMIIFKAVFMISGRSVEVEHLMYCQIADRVQDRKSEIYI